MHKARVEAGELRTGLALDAEVDRDWRLGACQAHSATHVIHEALHQILGPTALQAGSYNRPGYMRLDFSWGHGVSDEQRAEIESAVEPSDPGRLRGQREPDAAGGGEGARCDGAVRRGVRRRRPGRRHGRGLVARAVRRYARGADLAGRAAGGQRRGVASGPGIRRIEAFVGHDAFQQLAKERSLVQGLADSLKVQPDQLADRVAKMVAQLKEAEREIAALKSANLMTLVDPIVAPRARDVGRHVPLPSRGRHRRQRPALAGAGGPGPGRAAAGGGRAGRRYGGQAEHRRGDHRRCAGSPAQGRRPGPGRLARRWAVAAAARTTSPRAAAATASQSAAALTAVEHAIGHVLQIA